MAKFITVHYGDERGYERTSPAVRDSAHAHDAALKRSGVLIGAAGPPVQVRNPEARRVHTEEGPFLSASLPVAGFAILDAPDLAAAVEMVSRSPCAVAYGVVEVWPLEQPGDAA